MKRIFIHLILFFPFLGFSQGEFNNWHFGTYSSITFNQGAPQVLPPNLVAQDHQVGISVSDSAGNILFYSNGTKVWNRNNGVMPNGNGLLGSNGNQMSSVQNLNNQNQYFVFTVGVSGLLPPYPYVGLHYSVLDMQLDGGNGDIVSGMKNIPLPMGDSAIIQLTATRHQNNKDVWVVALRHGKKRQYLSYLIDSSGIHTTPVISSSALNRFWRGDMEFMRISPDGNNLVCSDSLLEICLFDKSTGIVMPKFTCRPGVIYPGWSHVDGKEFSIDSRYLYVNAPDTTIYSPLAVFQLDMNYSDPLTFIQSQVKICDSVDASLQMAPDGKIYITRYQDWNSPFLDAINNPSIGGTGCNYQYQALTLNSMANGSLPQFLQKYKAYLHHTEGCMVDSVHFSADIWPPADSIHWDFGDPASGINNYSNLAAPAHLYTTPGNHMVELWLRHNDKRTDTTWVTVNVPEPPAPQLGNDKTVCSGNSATFDAGVCATCSFLWRNLSTGLPVGSDQTFTTGIAGQYEAVVTDANGCTGRDTVELSITPVPVLMNDPLSKSICTGEPTDISLTSNDSTAMFHWTATLTLGAVTGFSADSGLVISQTLVNGGATAGVVIYHITPKVGDCAGTPVDYTVTVNVGDLVDVTITASGNTVCAGNLVTFTANPINPGASPVYQWKLNGVNAGSNATTFAYVPANGDAVKCILASSNVVCTSNNPATSNLIAMVVNPLQQVSVVVSPTANPVCAGTAVTFNAVPSNGGTIPVYQWKVNGINTGGNLSTYTYTPVNGDAISCVLTSNVNCPTGNPASSLPINMIVHPLLPVSISISPSANPFCLANPVTYTAVPVNGGLSPNYQWKVNGTNAGLNNSVFTYTPANGDAVTCVLNSSALCPTGNPASSNSITMVVNTSLPAGLAITASANPFCPGSPVVFTASPANGGSIPVYQWKVNGLNAGVNSPTYTYLPINDDSVRCVMTSNLNCVTGNPASSAKIIMLGTLAPTVIFTSCFDTLTTVNAKPYKLKGGIPLGGTYSGPGVNSVTGTFTPSLAGIGLKSIVYTYTNVVVCSANKTKTINVQSTAPFTCGNNLTDIRDAKTYPTVQIGTQCWMAANLNYGNQISPSQVQFDNCIAEKYCYNDNPLNCTNNGGLYQWDEMMKYDDTPAGQGLCPPGWHVPTETDWTTLFNFYLGNALAGKPLQDTNITGFKALTSGVFYLNSSWSFNGFATLFWSSTPWNATKGISHGLNVYDFSVSLYPSSRANAFPVRCTRD